jgi:hypothetical protein
VSKNRMALDDGGMGRECTHKAPWCVLARKRGRG